MQAKLAARCRFARLAVLDGSRCRSLQLRTVYAQASTIQAEATAARGLSKVLTQDRNDTFPGGSVATKPAIADAVYFNLDPSVSAWAEFSAYTAEDSFGAVLAAAGEAQREAASVSNSPQDAAYWTYHFGRFGFFIAQGLASLVAYRASDVASNAQNTFYPGRFKEFAARLLESTKTFKQDLANIQRGYYKMPWDMTTLSHRQYNPAYVLRKSAQYMAESARILDRRNAEAPAFVWLRSSMYPQYYQYNFHHQTDGWFSAKSASHYEVLTETLFSGRQDAMQRSGLIPLSQYLAARKPSQVRLLEVACGTGRLHTFIKDNWPEMNTTASDLSPFYLEQARNNLAYWKSKRQPKRDLGGVDGTGVNYLQCAAESIDAPDESYDVVLCTYLFHELPRVAREAAAAEFLRVLRPGGLLVLTDSMQLGDMPAWDNVIGVFSRFNEPHYKDYLEHDFGGMFSSLGFVCGGKWMSSRTKTLSFRKPGGDVQPRRDGLQRMVYTGGVKGNGANGAVGGANSLA